jgi:MoxR-like ATPase
VQNALTRDVQAFTSQPLVDEAKVSQAVTDAVAAAFKPFEQAVIAAGAQAAVGSMVSVVKTGCESALDVFGVSVTNASGGELWANLFNDPSAPAVDPCFVWTKPILQHLLLSQTTGENLWFGGEKGTGKSETVRQFAAKTGRGYTRINFNKYTTSEDFVGAVGLENGATVFKMGDFLRAFTTPASLILLDEITNADPAVLAVLNGFLETNSAVNYGGQVWRRAPNVLVFAADNTMTNGDESGRYAGTRTMNSALADRFARLVAFKHMELDVEVEAVVRHTGCKPALAEHVLKAVHACRAKVESGDIVDAPSIRSVMAFVRSVAVLGVDEAWAASIGHRQPSESATAIASIKAAYIDAAFIQRNL